MDYRSMAETLLGLANPVRNAGGLRERMIATGRPSANVEDQTVSPTERYSFMKGIPQDARGRWLVPENWQAPEDFAGTIIKNGMEISYPGPRR